MKKTIRITEDQYRYYALAEDVFVSNLDKKKGRAQLTYSRSSGYNRGNKMSNDYLKTDKMDMNNEDTYLVPLKNGMMSYNITSINGTEVMHYFKRIFDRQKTSIKDTEGNEYELEMANSEFNSFMTRFTEKVNVVVDHAIRRFKQQNPKLDFEQCYIYPVPSRSNFNVEMGRQMCSRQLGGLPVDTLNTALLQKDTTNIEIDNNFVNRNRSYYNSQRSATDIPQGTHGQAVRTALNKLKARTNIDEYIDQANQCVEQLLKLYYWRNRDIKKLDVYYTKLADAYCAYSQAVKDIRTSARYFDEFTKEYHVPYMKSLAQAIKYTKGPSVEKRSGEIYDMLRTNAPELIRGVKQLDVCRWQKLDFQIKKEGNDVRMALQNYFQPNSDEDIVKAETEHINTGVNVIVVFDDNISGGATLSDICVQLKKLGAQFIIPITFGKMKTNWSAGRQALAINQPEGGFNMES